MECGPCGSVPRERARAPNFGLSGGGGAPARLAPRALPAHHHSPPQRIHLRNTSVGLTTTATPGSTHWEKLLIFQYCLPEIVHVLRFY